MKCRVDPETKGIIENFGRKQRQTTAALVLKLDAEGTVFFDKKYEDTTIEKLANDLPKDQPRYVLLDYLYEHSDGRITHPRIFISYIPLGSSAREKILHTSYKSDFAVTFRFTKQIQVVDEADLTERLILRKLESSE